MFSFCKNFIITFLAVMVINQFFYGNCYEDHCLAAALPKVIVISLIVAFGLYQLKKSK